MLEDISIYPYEVPAKSIHFDDEIGRETRYQCLAKLWSSELQEDCGLHGTSQEGGRTPGPSWPQGPRAPEPRDVSGCSTAIHQGGPRELDFSVKGLGATQRDTVDVMGCWMPQNCKRRCDVEL